MSGNLSERVLFGSELSNSDHSVRVSSDWCLCGVIFFVALWVIFLGSFPAFF